MNWQDFHFLRPLWLLALVPTALVMWRLWRRRLTATAWRRVVDPVLLPHLLVGDEGRLSRWPLVLAALGFGLAILALAGPAWERQPQPVFSRQAPLVILFDLSRSMDARDLKPSRLARARFKVEDLLAARREGQTALVAFAGAPFTVVPLTDDAATIRALLPALATSLMPVQGSNVAAAIAQAEALLKGAGEETGDILVVGDGVNGPAAAEAAASARQHRYRVSVLAVGTPDGAPIPTRHGALEDGEGRLVVARLDERALQAVARAGGGHYARITVDDSDLKRLGLLQPKASTADTLVRKDQKVARWKDMGPWLVPLLLPLAALAFRRGILVVLLAVVSLVPAPPARAGWWQDLWQRPDQQGQALLQARKPEAAAERFRDPDWKAAALYRAGRYQEAERLWKQQDDARAWYDRGNALAHMKRYQDAIEAYRQALKRDPNLEDARVNMALVKRLLDRQRQHKQQQNRRQNQKNQKQGDKQKQAAQNQKQQQEQQEGQQQQQSSGRSGQQKDKQSSGKQQNKQGGAGRSGDQKQNQAQRNQGRNKDQADKQGGKKEQPRLPDAEREAQRRREQKALRQELERRMAEQGKKGRAEKDRQSAAAKPTPAGQRPKAAKPIDEKALAREQWLKRIPDDPGELLKRKFRYYYQRLPHETPRQNPW